MLIKVTTRTGAVEYLSILQIVRITFDDEGAIIQMLNGEKIYTTTDPQGVQALYDFLLSRRP